MSTKMKAHALNGMHAAGIYSDMTVDGPEIGTLVVIVDRAKNLPNRKTIGKQDPYCAARLGKEAKKTETDRRGGQTPRWDEELRFTVHDSPDYHQLKVSVFNDDKKTDLIGETWVNLQEVLVPGGGQNDLWHNLSYRGKYAGEIRIEITYYDTRPKPEKPEKTKQSAASGVDEGGRDSLRGPRQPNASPVKRRPLPNEPVAAVPTPLPTANPEPIQTPPRGYQHPGYIPNQSPLQSVEYNTTPQRSAQLQGLGNSPGINEYGAATVIAVTPAPLPMMNDIYEIYDPMPRNDYTQVNGMDLYGADEAVPDPRDRYHSQQATYQLPSPEEYRPPPSPSGPPPPPPAHGSKPGSQHTSPAAATTAYTGYGFSPDSRHSNPYDTPPSNMQRHSMPDYHQRNSYQAYGRPAAEDHIRQSGYGHGFQNSQPVHHTFDSGYRGEYGSMQPTVEDAPPSPSPASAGYSGYPRSGSNVSPHDERRYEQVPSPAPLNLSGRGSAASGRNSVSTVASHQFSNSWNGYASAISPVSFRDQSRTGTSLSSRTSYSTLPTQHQQQRRQSEDPMTRSPGGFSLPPVPPTLVAGMDPSLAQEISDRIYHENRASVIQSNNNSPRGRYQDSPQHQSHPLSHGEPPVHFMKKASSFDDRQSRYSTATHVPIVKPRALSPDPRTPARKPVSPSPGASDPSSDVRRLSGVPFGPDSYDALNPSVAGTTASPVFGVSKERSDLDPDAKIITHDGREIDPSDHIPESNYAPLRETKHKYASQLPDRNYRPPPIGSQTMSASSPRPLRQNVRPQSMVAVSPTYMTNGQPDPSTPTGRNRLQKKANRTSTHPSPHSSPLAPISPHQNNSYAPRSLPRLNTGDYSHENYAPTHYGSSPGYGRGSVAGPPPIPAKVPMSMNSAPPLQPSGGDAQALLEEMRSIDLGTGRARRRVY